MNNDKPINNSSAYKKKCRGCEWFDGEYSGWCKLLHKVVFAACSCTAPEYTNLKAGDQMKLF